MTNANMNEIKNWIDKHDTTQIADPSRILAMDPDEAVEAVRKDLLAYFDIFAPDDCMPRREIAEYIVNQVYLEPSTRQNE